jgi:outer membrane protein assembly factor BamB
MRLTVGAVKGGSRVAGRVVAALLLSSAAAASALAQEWPQWGGPSRNFKSAAKGLAASWPEKGPRQLWSRDLGAGHSSIVVDGDTLYTMYSQGEQESVIAVSASTGKTIWEHKYEAPTAGMNYEYGVGPHATPLIVGNLIYTVGATARLHALDKKTGKVVWSHDLLKEYNGLKFSRGYPCSPIAYKGTVILPVGRKGQAVMAFNQKDGAVVWKNQDFDIAPAAPLLINVDGQDQLVVFGGKEINGLDPSNGELLWSHRHATEWGLNISTPVWGEDNLLFCSSAYNGGSRVLKLARKDGKTTVEELWFHRRMRVHIGTVIRVGDYLYGSSGDFGPSFLSAVDVRTGKTAWQDRSFSKASFVYADGKFIILDEDGHLALATLSPEGIKVISKVELLTSKSWTVPTLVGTRLYVRDRKTMMALDLK